MPKPHREPRPARPSGAPAAPRRPPPAAVARAATARATTKEVLHPRSRHRARYDFRVLCASSPELRSFVARNPHGDESVDFADPRAVRALNAALLKQFYGIARWDLPEPFLCPPIPGRADHLHYAADLLAEDNGGAIPRGPAVRVLDIGVGANCIYPLIGQHEYGWSFVGSDIDAAALAVAQRTIYANPGLAALITCRRQTRPGGIFQGVVQPGEGFALSLCNPPFHASLQEAHAGTRRKLDNLGKGGPVVRGRQPRAAPVLNFGGQEAELWCPGGEAAFVGRMVAESASLPRACLWFTSLIAKEANLPRVLAALKAVRPADTRVIDMAQGQKRSRLVAWTFADVARRQAWWREQAVAARMPPSRR